MDDLRKDEAKLEHDLEIDDLEVDGRDADDVRGGAGTAKPDPGYPGGVSAQHNETLLES
jgi:hypothetical protein